MLLDLFFADLDTGVTVTPDRQYSRLSRGFPGPLAPDVGVVVVTRVYTASHSVYNNIILLLCSRPPGIASENPSRTSVTPTDASAYPL